MAFRPQYAGRMRLAFRAVPLRPASGIASRARRFTKDARLSSRCSALSFGLQIEQGLRSAIRIARNGAGPRAFGESCRRKRGLANVPARAPLG
jgi:hypothetical protein